MIIANLLVIWKQMRKVCRSDESLESTGTDRVTRAYIGRRGSWGTCCVVVSIPPWPRTVSCFQQALSLWVIGVDRHFLVNLTAGRQDRMSWPKPAG